MTTRNFADPLRILALAHAGHTAAEAAEVTGLALYTVREAARQMGVKFRDPRTPTADTVDRMVADREAGMTWAQLGDKYGMCGSGVRKIVLRAEGAL